jgi:hypothetical protein
MPLIPFPEYRPDISDYQGNSSLTITGVLPRGDGYGPMAGSAAFSNALVGTCRGAFVAWRTDGTVAIFATTSTNIYLLDNTALTWANVSKGGGPYTALASTDQWRFAQFGNFVIAVQANTVPQVYDLGTPVLFADLGGSPPTSRYVDIVGRFVVLSGLTANPYRIQWSGLNAATTWTSGVNSSDFQDFPDGGIVRGVAGGESGVIFQDAAIRRMTFAPGSPFVFQIERISQDRGLYAPYSLVKAGDKTFFLTSQGFYGITPGELPAPIGKEKFDRTFLADVDRGNLQLVIGAADPRSSRVFWAYKSIAGTVGYYDKLLCYDWALQRATLVPMMGEFLLGIAQPGTTLEGLDSISGSLDALIPSLDSFATSVAPELAQFDTIHKLAFFRGANIEAILETTEEGTDGQRVAVNGLRPITDAPTVYGSVSKRENAQTVATYSTETLINSIGMCPASVSTRYSRGRARIPAGTSWTFAAGIEPKAVIVGRQ